MFSKPRTLFAHRLNRNGSHDSICPQCFRTIGNRKMEAELSEDERKHHCESWALKARRQILVANPVPVNQL